MKPGSASRFGKLEAGANLWKDAACNQICQHCVESAQYAAGHLNGSGTSLVMIASANAVYTCSTHLVILQHTAEPPRSLWHGNTIGSHTPGILRPSRLSGERSYCVTGTLIVTMPDAAE